MTLPARRSDPPSSVRAGGRRRIVWVGAFSAALLLAFGATRARAVNVPQGQESVLMTMLGHGAPLPDGCRFDGGTNADVITATYACREGRVVVQLSDPDDAPPEALRTQSFAIVVESGPAPEGLREALADLIRAHESALRFRPMVPPALHGLIAGAIAIIVVVFAVQLLLDRRRPRSSTEGRPAVSSTADATASPVPASWIVLAAAIVGGYLLSRLLFLERLPAFVDEAIHIEWARSAVGAFTELQVSVGKWLPVQWMALFVRLPFAPLTGARLASVSMGLATLAACMLIGRELFSSTVGLLAAVVYALLPFALLYDRLALADVYVSAFAAWATFVAIAMRRHSGPGWTLALNACAFGAILAKPSGAMFLSLPLLVAALLVARGERASYLQRCLPSVVGGAVFAAFLLAEGYGAGLVADQASLHAAGLAGRFFANLQAAGEWFMPLLTPTVVWLAAAGVLHAFVQLRDNRWEEAFLVALLALSVLPYAIVSTLWYPRYALFLVVPVALLVARTIVAAASMAARAVARQSASAARLTRHLVIAGALLVLIGTCLPRNVALITDPVRAALPPIEHSLYISGTSAGYGVPELAAFLADRAQRSEINVVRFGRTPAKEAINLYRSGALPMQMHVLDGPVEAAAGQIATLARDRPTFLIVDRELDGAAVSPVTPIERARQIWSYARPGGQTQLEVWEVPPPSGA